MIDINIFGTIFGLVGWFVFIMFAFVIPSISSYKDAKKRIDIKMWNKLNDTLDDKNRYGK